MKIIILIILFIKLLIIFAIYQLYLILQLKLEREKVPEIPIINKYKRFINNKTKLIPIITQWGEILNKSNILKEYPRPQFVRNSYINLNGEWNYSLKNNNYIPDYDEYNETIIVPFSIESPLSGVLNKSLEPNMTLWYKKIINLRKVKNYGRFLLHFGAVDQNTEVFINNQSVGEHEGGYNSFYFDITNYLGKDLSKVEIIVKVVDDFDKDGAAIGKQGNPPGRIFYSKTGGIWQTVWIESVPKVYIKDVKITPNYDNHSVSFLMSIDGDKEKVVKGKIKIYDNEEKLLINCSKIIPGIETNIILPENFSSWSPENPYLYKLEYFYRKDTVKAYFGMRKFSIGKDKNNIKRLFLNNKPYFQNGVLDQGYWPDGIYTAPSDEAIIYDIKMMKDLGFNMLRKHIKIEPKRWYYHCDTIGMLVWQDQPSGGEFPYNGYLQYIIASDSNYTIFSRDCDKGRTDFIRDLSHTIENLYNSPCIATWVPFNEGWGQFDSVAIAKFIKDLDNTRFVDHTSGWIDQGGPDFKSLHIYKETITFEPDKYKRPIVLSEYGGFGCLIKNHTGYKKAFSYKEFNTSEISDAVNELILEEIFPNIEKGLCAAVYTQLSDIEEEINGLMTYNRKILKVDKKAIKKTNDLLKIKI